MRYKETAIGTVRPWATPAPATQPQAASWTPFGEALLLAGLILGACVCLFAACVVLVPLAGWGSVWQAWRVGLCVDGLLLAGLGITAVTMGATRLWRVWLFPRVELMTGLDLDHSGAIGDPIVHAVTVNRPEPPNPPLQIEVHEPASIEGGGQVRLLDLALPHSQIRRLAGAILAGQTSERELNALGITRGMWIPARDAMLARGLLQWKSEADRRQGTEPTATGRAVLESLRHLPDRDMLESGS